MSDIKKFTETIKYRGLKYDGKNGKAVVEFANEQNRDARAGGGWVKVFSREVVMPDTIVKKGEWLLVNDGTGELFVANQEYVDDNFKAAR